MLNVALSCRGYSHIGNITVNPKIPYKGNEGPSWGDYYRRMAQKPFDDWFLKEWMNTLHVSNKQLQEEAGWTYRITSQLINRKLRWNRDHLNLAARILRLRPYELLMHPDDANAIRRWRAEALTIAADKTEAFRPAPPELAKVGK